VWHVQDRATVTACDTELRTASPWRGGDLEPQRLPVRQQQQRAKQQGRAMWRQNWGSSVTEWHRSAAVGRLPVDDKRWRRQRELGDRQRVEEDFNNDDDCIRSTSAADEQRGQLWCQANTAWCCVSHLSLDDTRAQRAWYVSTFYIKTFKYLNWWSFLLYIIYQIYYCSYK